jgi:serine/threonine protein kinase
MKFIKGGELFHQLAKEKRFPEARVKFYATQIILGLGHLHTMSIIYRDIKPENILLDSDGYLLLADFGLAKTLASPDQLATSFCGTPEYLAPEIIKNVGHNHAVDWWSIGILIYEMIVGFPPFYHKNQQTMYDLIEKFPVKYPDPVKHKIHMSEEVKDLITQLLIKDPKTRLGTQNDMNEILAHAWFQDIDMDKLVKKQIIPDFIPEIKGEDDTSQFDS